ncbi:GINS complex subunit, partial [Rhizoclosmatium hyalinum]
MLANTDTHDTTDTIDTDDIQLLTQAWINERGAPEILAFEGQVIDRLLELLRAQEEHVEELSNDDANDIDFVRSVYLHEADRVKFVLQSYLRTRLFKIEQKTLAILKSPEYQACLSESELAYAQRFNQIVQETYEKSFLLDSLPPSLQSMDDPNIVGAPDLNQAVFFRTKVDFGDHLLP